MPNNDQATSVDESKKNLALFAQLVEILTQNALMMLGGIPDRSGRPRPPDLKAAEMMIDMLMVLQLKTKGNLSAEEDRMIKGTLYQLQAAFADIASKSGDFEKARKATESMESAESESGDMLDEEMEEDSTEPMSAEKVEPKTAKAPTPPVAPSKKDEESKDNKVKYTKKYGAW